MTRDTRCSASVGFTRTTVKQRFARLGVDDRDGLLSRRQLQGLQRVRVRHGRQQVEGMDVMQDILMDMMQRMRIGERELNSGIEQVGMASKETLDVLLQSIAASFARCWPYFGVMSLALK